MAVVAHICSGVVNGCCWVLMRDAKLRGDSPVELV